MTFLIIFIILSVFNVVLSTARSIITIKCGKWLSAIASAVYFGFYNVMLIYTVADFPMWQKVLITAVTNLVGVFVVKLIEEKMRKDKLWLVKITIPSAKAETVIDLLKENGISHQYSDIGRHYVIDTFCENKQQTAIVTNIAKMFHGKTFATESEI